MPSAQHPDPISRDTRVLAICQGLFTAAISIDLTLTALTGHMLAPIKALATLPFALITVAGAVVTWFASMLIGRIGRRRAFSLGALSATVGGLVSMLAVFRSDFWMFCAGTALVGVFQAFAQFYRLAAADAVAGPLKSRAIAWVMSGGVIAAVAGPALAAWAKDLFPSALFAGAYLMIALLGVASLTLLMLVYRGTDAVAATGTTSVAEPERPLGEIMRQPIYIAALANNVVASVTMMFVMTAAPLAAVAHHHSIDDGANIMQWHLVGMYAPALFAGALIQRIGLARVLGLGLVLNLICSIVAMYSTSLVAFYVALLCLGVGWNFMYVGGTTLLSQSYRPVERARAQGTSELMRYVLTALATLCAGPALDAFGWATLNTVMLPLIALAALMTWTWARRP